MTDYNRVPAVTADFWLIKLMAVTMGETAADFLAVNLGLGLTTTSLMMAAVLVVAIGLQFAQKRYVPWAYWLAVVLTSVVGTLITDNLVDNLHVPLQVTTAAFAFLLAVTFVAWHRLEGTLSIHSIFTRRREAFYWLAILFTFALGTAAGDLVAEQFALGYHATGILFGMIIATAAIWRGRTGDDYHELRLPRDDYRARSLHDGDAPRRRSGVGERPGARNILNSEPARVAVSGRRDRPADP